MFTYAEMKTYIFKILDTRHGTWFLLHAHRILPTPHLPLQGSFILKKNSQLELPLGTFTSSWFIYLVKSLTSSSCALGLKICIWKVHDPTYKGFPILCIGWQIGTPKWRSEQTRFQFFANEFEEVSAQVYPWKPKFEGEMERDSTCALGFQFLYSNFEKSAHKCALGFEFLHVNFERREHKCMLGFPNWGWKWKGACTCMLGFQFFHANFRKGMHKERKMTINIKWSYLKVRSLIWAPR